MKIRKAKLSDKDYVISRNKIIDEISGFKDESVLEENFERDFFISKVAFCDIFEEDGRTVGFCIYSHAYRANSGRGIYLSNVYFEPEYRRRGGFGEVIKHLQKKFNPKYITFLVGRENKVMQKVARKYQAKNLGLNAYIIRDFA